MANWDQIQSSGDVEDLRGNVVTGGAVSIGVLAVVGLLMFAGGATPEQILQTVGDLQGQSVNTTQGEFVDTKNYKQFAQRVLGSNNQLWRTELAKQNMFYKSQYRNSR